MVRGLVQQQDIGPAHGDDMQYLRVYISQVREKVEDDISAPEYIVTEPGIGYRMEVMKESEDNAAQKAPAA